MKLSRKLFSLLIVICMCVSLIPAAMVSAENTTYVTRANTIPADFSGQIVKYNIDGSGHVTLDVGMYNPPMGGLWSSGIEFDSNVLDFWNPKTQKFCVDGNATSQKNAVVPDYVVSELDKIGELGDTTAINDSGMGLIGTTSIHSPEQEEGVKRYRRSDAIQTANVLKDLQDFYNGTFSLDPIGYQPPKDVFVGIYTLHLHLKDGVDASAIKWDTIRMTELGSDGFRDAPYGSGITATGEGIVNNNTLLLGFPEKPYTVSMTVNNDQGAPLEGASVAVTKQGDTNPTDTQTTNAQGQVSFSLPNAAYTYTITAASFKTRTGSFTVSGADNTMEPVQMEVQPEATYTVTIPFKDANNSSLAGVKVTPSLDGVEKAPVTSGANGNAVLNLPVGAYSYKAELEGYVTQRGSFTIEDGNAPQTLAAVTMPKEPEPKYTATFQVTEDGSEPAVNVGDASIVISTASGQAVTTIKTDANGTATCELETGSYKYSISKLGYVTQTDVAFAISGAVLTVPVSLAKRAVSGDPKYTVTGEYDEETGIYTVKAQIANLVSSGGTFGLKYDSSILTLKETEGVYATYGDAVELAPENLPQKEAGYLTFGWLAKDKLAGVNASAAPVDLVTYQFQLSKEDYDTWVDSETLTVMPWLETKAAEGMNEDANGVIWQAAPADDKQAIGGGYYQAQDRELDELVNMLYEFTYEHRDRYRLNYTVVEKDTEPATPIANATITIYDATDLTVDPMIITTDENGRTKQNVGAGSYKYRVDAQGYWSSPINPDEYIAFEIVDEGQSFDVTLEAEEKHDVAAAATHGVITVGDQSGPSLNLTEKAIKGVDFLFMAVPDPGYKRKAPTYKIGEAGETKTAALDVNTNKYKIPGAEITDTVIIDVTFEADTFTITANIGQGGTLSYDGTDYTNAGVATDTVLMGTDSKKIVYTADENNTIHEIVVNGVKLPVADDQTTFEQTFTDVRADQTVSVTFKINGTPVEYVVSVAVGDYGKVEVKEPAAKADTVLAGKQKDFIIPKEEDLKADTAPADSDTYEIDKIIVNNDQQTVTNPVLETVTISYNDIAKQHLVATFKGKDSEETFQHTVESRIMDGQGSVTPLGIRIYNKGEAPVYTLTPDPKWKISKVILQGTPAPDTGEGAPDDGRQDVTGEIAEGKYTFQPIADDLVLEVTFGEVTITVSGSVRYAQGEPALDGATITRTMPQITFTRTSDGKVFYGEYGAEASAINASGPTSSAFSAALADGEYTIKVTKHGHLAYTITNYTVTIDPDNPDNNTDKTINNAIDLLAGNTDTDNTVTFYDIIRISDGIGIYKERADIDETGTVTVDDMNYAKDNYAKGAPKYTITEHEALNAVPEV